MPRIHPIRTPTYPNIHLDTLNTPIKSLEYEVCRAKPTSVWNRRAHCISRAFVAQSVSGLDLLSLQAFMQAMGSMPESGSCGLPAKVSASRDGLSLRDVQKRPLGALCVAPPVELLYMWHQSTNVATLQQCVEGVQLNTLLNVVPL